MKYNQYLNINKLNLTLYVFFVSSILLKIYHYYEIPVFDIEEFFKVNSLFSEKKISYFFPGKHPEFSFFGHPGLNNFLFYLFSFFSERTLFAVRIFNILFSYFTLFTLYLYLKDALSKKVAFFTVICLSVMPMFYIQSLLFFNEIPSIGFMFLSLYLYNKERMYSFSVFACMAVLVLESAVALYVALIITTFLIHGKEVFLKRARYLFFPIFTVMAFFLCEFLATGSWSNHPTAANLDLSFFEKMSINGFVKYKLEPIVITLYENFSYEGIFVYFILIFFLYRKKTRSKLNYEFLTIFTLTSFFFISYFFVFGEYIGGRDFYFILFFIVILCFYSLDTFQTKKINFLSYIVLVMFLLISYRSLVFNQETWFQSSLKEFERVNSYRSLLNKVARQKETIICSDFSLGKFFCSDIYFKKTSNLRKISFDRYERDQSFNKDKDAVYFLQNDEQNRVPYFKNNISKYDILKSKDGVVVVLIPKATNQ